MSVWRRVASAWTHQMIDHFFTEPGATDKDTVRVSSDSTMRLTQAEAQQLADEIHEVLERWSQHGQQSGADGDGAGRRTYLALAFVQPYPQGVPRPSDSDL